MASVITLRRRLGHRYWDFVVPAVPANAGTSGTGPAEGRGFPDAARWLDGAEAGAAGTSCRVAGLASVAFGSSTRTFDLEDSQVNEPLRVPAGTCGDYFATFTCAVTQQDVFTYSGGPTGTSTRRSPQPGRTLRIVTGGPR